MGVFALEQAAFEMKHTHSSLAVSTMYSLCCRPCLPCIWVSWLQCYMVERVDSFQQHNNDMKISVAAK